MVKMERVIVLLSLNHFCLTSAATHSLQYFYTATSGIPDFPEFVTVGMVDGEPFSYYDSNMRREIPKQEWVKEAVDTDYWDRNTQISIAAESNFKADIEILKKRFNQTGGAHTVQNMYGCEWDDDTGRTYGYDQYGYDGEDFLIFDLKSMSWIAPAQQAFLTKMKWNSERALSEQEKMYLTEECIEWLKKYVGYGRSKLERKVPPEVTLLQRDPSSPVTCHATGFYPREIVVSWQKNGEDLQEDVELGETMPNEDGTFQIRSFLRVSPEDMKMLEYTCTVQHSSLQKDVVKSLKEDQENFLPVAVIISVVIAALLSVIAVIGFLVWKRKSGYSKSAPESSDCGSKDPTVKAEQKQGSAHKDLAGKGYVSSYDSLFSDCGSESSSSSDDSRTPLKKPDADSSGDKGSVDSGVSADEAPAEKDDGSWTNTWSSTSSDSSDGSTSTLLKRK